MQRRATIWILKTFKISPSFSIEAIVGFIPINLHLQKLSGRSQLQTHSLPPNHILWFLMEPRTGSASSCHSLLLGTLTKCQCKLIKGPLVNIDNRFNKVHPLFDPLHLEFSSGHRVIDTFSSHFSFHLFNKCKDANFKTYIQQLDNLAFESLSILSCALIIIDTSVKNNIAISISHTYIHNRPVTKTLHHAVNIISTEAKLFVIKCGINQATNHNNISKIIIITDSIHAARKISQWTLHILLASSGEFTWILEVP